MKVRDLFIGIKQVGRYQGQIGLFVEMGGEKEVSPTKLVNRIVKMSPVKRVFIYNIVEEELHDLSFVVGDLSDLRFEVIAILQQGVSLEFISTMVTWVEQQIVGSGFIKQRFVNDIIWYVKKESVDEMLKVAFPKQVNVSVIPQTTKDVVECWRLITLHPNWRFYPKTLLALRNKKAKSTLQPSLKK